MQKVINKSLAQNPSMQHRVTHLPHCPEQRFQTLLAFFPSNHCCLFMPFFLCYFALGESEQVSVQLYKWHLGDTVQKFKKGKKILKNISIPFVVEIFNNISHHSCSLLALKTLFDHSSTGLMEAQLPKAPGKCKAKIRSSSGPLSCIHTFACRWGNFLRCSIRVGFPGVAACQLPRLQNHCKRSQSWTGYCSPQPAALPAQKSECTGNDPPRKICVNTSPNSWSCTVSVING